MDDYILVCFNENHFIYPHLKEDIKVSSFFKKSLTGKIKDKMINKIYRVMCFFKLHKFVYGEWYSQLKLGKKIVFLDECGIDYCLKRIINKYKNNVRIYLWNSSFKIKNFSSILKIDCPIFTFDLNDSEEYNIKYKPSIVLNISQSELEIVYDVSFIGLNKGRKVFFDNFKKRFNKIICYFNIIDENVIGYEYPVKYIDYLNILKKSKCIIEILQNNQGGETIRTVEAIVSGKKLITNNINITKMSYYNENNILLIENDIESLDEEKLLEFINKPISSYDLGDIESRFPLKWIKSFFEGEDISV